MCLTPAITSVEQLLLVAHDQDALQSRIPADAADRALSASELIDYLLAESDSEQDFLDALTLFRHSMLVRTR